MPEKQQSRLAIDAGTLRKHGVQLPDGIPDETLIDVVNMNLARLRVMPDEKTIEFVELIIRAVSFDWVGKKHTRRGLNFVHRFPGDIRN